MKDITRERIYNKTEENINKEDLSYLKKLVSKQQYEVITTICNISAFVVANVFLLGAGCKVLLALLLSALITVGFRGLIYMGDPFLKDLDLNNKEWKELKKSGRLKEISKIIDSYENSDRAQLESLSEKEHKLKDELNEIETKKQRIIQKMIKINLSKSTHEAGKESTKNKQLSDEHSEELEVGI